MKSIDRIAQYLSNNEIKPHKFEKIIHVSNGYFNKQLKKKASIGSDILLKISENYDDLNMHWVITGEGCMIKST